MGGVPGIRNRVWKDLEAHHCTVGDSKWLDGRFLSHTVTGEVTEIWGPKELESLSVLHPGPQGTDGWVVHCTTSGVPKGLLGGQQPGCEHGCGEWAAGDKRGGWSSRERAR